MSSYGCWEKSCDKGGSLQIVFEKINKTLFWTTQYLPNK